MRKMTLEDYFEKFDTDDLPDCDIEIVSAEEVDCD